MRRLLTTLLIVMSSPSMAALSINEGSCSLQVTEAEDLDRIFHKNIEMTIIGKWDTNVSSSYTLPLSVTSTVAVGHRIVPIYSSGSRTKYIIDQSFIDQINECLGDESTTPAPLPDPTPDPGTATVLAGTCPAAVAQIIVRKSQREEILNDENEFCRLPGLTITTGDQGSEYGNADQSFYGSFSDGYVHFKNDKFGENYQSVENYWPATLQMLEDCAALACENF